MTTKDEARRLLERFSELTSSAEDSDSDYLISLLVDKANDLVKARLRRATTIELVLTY